MGTEQNEVPRIHLAPMEGVVDFVNRSLYSRIGGYDQFVTEFVRVTTRLLPKKVFHKYAPELLPERPSYSYETQKGPPKIGYTSEGTPVYVQLLGGEPQVLADNAGFVSELGAPGIDLNFGCPAKTVNRNDGGATLLKNPERLYRIITAVRKAVPPGTPVTAKVRLGFDDKSKALEIAQAVDAAGASSLTVHARTKLEGYRPPAHWEFIKKMSEAVENVPVIANGDIWSVRDYLRCREVTGLKDIAIGRPAIAKPDLALAIKAKYQDKNYREYIWKDLLGSLIPRFITMNMDYRGEDYALARTKQWIKLLCREYEEAKDLFEAIKRLKSIDEIGYVISERNSFMAPRSPEKYSEAMLPSSRFM